jgi:hypothetical protein
VCGVYVFTFECVYVLVLEVCYFKINLPN